MHKAEFFKEFGSTAACTIRLATGACREGDVFKGDSYFGQVKVAKELKESYGINSDCIVKSGYAGYPREYLETTMKDWPAEISLVLRSCDGDQNVVAIGYKYHSKTVACFICTYGTYRTTNGVPYKSKYQSAHGNYATRDIGRPEACTAFYKAANVIDIHNQQRQGFWKLERHWKSNCGFFRCITSIIAMHAVDTHLVAENFFSFYK